jgi:signal peptidase I
MAEQIATANVDANPEEAKPKPEQARNGIAEWAVTILLLLFGTTTLVQAFVIPTGSMEDTLLIGDHLLVDKLAYAPVGPVSRFLLPYEEPKHGDIIVFRYPGQISQTFVKRVIGVPGDRIKLVNQTIYRNGAPIYEPYVYHKYTIFSGTEEFPSDAYIRHDDFPGASAEAIERNRLQRDMLEHHVVNGEVVIPPNSYFAMGDNRDNSLDSRYWGFVPRDYIIGKPVLIYWSYRASTEDLAGSSVGSMVNHFVDLGEHFFTRTRWNRTLRLIRGVPDNELSTHPLPINPGNPTP